MVADVKKCQTGINAVAALADGAQALVEEWERVKAAITDQGVDVTSSAFGADITIDGTTKTAWAWLAEDIGGQAQLLIQHPALVHIRSHKVASHRGGAL